jgi:4-diphosphocytidyl-2-C-methyl-D-erythritol kinase
MIDSLLLESPAKVNLRLEILKKRKDGYHELRTILQKIDLHDTIHLSLKKERGITIATDHPDLPVGKDNLVYQSVQSILKRSDYRGGVHIEIKKRIPLGAGLGGGSSNAAATLKALNQLLKMDLPEKELMGMGLRIGVDVPFFFLRGAAIGSGIGEQLKEIEIPGLWYVLIYPNFQVSTRWAYQNLVLTKVRFHLNFYKFLKTPKGISHILRNDLEEVVSRKYPEIAIMKELLLDAGAMGALMTGSGPTVFGFFSKEEDALEAYRKVKKMVRGEGWIVLSAHSIPV